MNEHAHNPDSSIWAAQNGEMYIKTEAGWKILAGHVWQDEEAQLREKYPALKDLWDKYQEVLALCKISG